MRGEEDEGSSLAPSLQYQKQEQLRQTEETCSFLTGLNSSPPEIVIILGTGLGERIADSFDEKVSVSYSQIPHFPQTTVEGHGGRLIMGSCRGRQVAVLQGRFHYYEGYSTRHLTFPLRVLRLLGAGFLVACNAAGGLNPHFTAGSLMLIRDHLNLIADNPLRGPNIEQWGPRFVDMSCAYDRQLRQYAGRKAASLGLGAMSEGVYAAVAGPSLETPAETRYLRLCGADAVGMSTVPEVIVARHAGLRVLGISVIVNVNDPDRMMPVLLEDVLAEAQKASAALDRLLLALLEEWPAG